MDRLILGCGYLGQQILPLWRQGDARLFATTRSTAKAAAWHAEGIVPILCDVLAPTSLTALPHVQTVLYAVGLDRAAGRSMREVYVQGLANVLDHLPRPDHFLYVSSTSVYGQTRGEWVDESAATEPTEESGQIVLEAERLLRSRFPEAIILRFAGIYGPGRLLRQQALEKGERLSGDPDQWLNLIHVEDGAQAVAVAEVQGKGGEIYNVCDNSPVRRRDFFTMLAQLLGAPAPTFGPAGIGLANRRISNHRLHAKWGMRLKYPSYVEGLNRLAV